MALVCKSVAITSFCCCFVSVSALITLVLQFTNERKLKSRNYLSSKNKSF